MATRKCYLLMLLFAVAIGVITVSADDEETLDNTIDPSGGWVSQIGELSLMHAHNTLSFSYFAVFGPNAHLCDGAGVAGLVGRNRYEWVDEQGTVTFILNRDSVRLEVVDGVASFCGSGWVGDSFTLDSFTATRKCVVETPRSHFAVVEPLFPEKRGAYVIKGDQVEVAPVRNEGSDVWILSRFVGASMTTVGLLQFADLNCSEVEK